MIAQPLSSALETSPLMLAPQGAGAAPELAELAVHYQKTDAGRDEIRSRALALPRVTRSLLLIMDARQSAAAWVQCLEGSSQADVQRLLTLGLIAPGLAPVAVSAPPVVPVAAQPSAMPPAWLQALDELGHEQLYLALTAQAKQQLGLLRGLAFVLEIEKCSGLDELRALAARLVQQVAQQRGSEAAGQLLLNLQGAGVTTGGDTLPLA